MSKIPYFWVIKFKIRLPTPETFELPVRKWQVMKNKFQEMQPFQKMRSQEAKV
jgi:hypothetical protein